MSKLVIAEKPSVGSAIANVLGANVRKEGYFEGNGYYVTWCIGHLVELAKAEGYGDYKKWNYEQLPIIPTTFEYCISKGKEKQMKIIGELMKNTDVSEIICATDAGREGELIFRLVYEKLKCKKMIKRLWISSLEQKSIQKGFQDLKSGVEYEHLYQAALCRAKADWIVGINATRLFSVLYGQTLNIGRVMSPTLAMIVERSASISSFQSEVFYTVVLDCGNFRVTSEKIKDKEKAEELKSISSCITIEHIESKEKVEKPPKLYDLTTLQRDANRILGFTASQTLEYVQSLYEKKICTYPRTDSRFLTEDMANSTLQVATACKKLVGCEKVEFIMAVEQVINNSKVTDHHAIIPTQKACETNLEELTQGERAVFQLLVKRLLVSLSDSHRYSETIVTANSGDVTFSTTGKIVVQEGFKCIHRICDGKEENVGNALPSMQIGDTFNVTSELKEGRTSPPKEFTDDTLLSAMENANQAEVDKDMKGIGTPATRAGIMEKLIKTGLVERKGDKKTKKFVPTHKGISLITVLPEVIQSPLLTAEWEEKLKYVEKGELRSEEFLKDIIDMTTALVKTYEVVNGADTLFPREQTREVVGDCPRCGELVTENKKGFCCNNRVCGFAIWKENKFFTAKKKTVTKSLIKELLQNGKAQLKGCYSEKTGKNYDCVVVLDDSGGKYVNFKMEFGKK